MKFDVFLLGAGASAPLGLPVSRGFLSGFKPSSNRLLELLVRYTRVKTQENLDIEEVFSLLQQSIESKDSLVLTIFKDSFWAPTGGWKRIPEISGATTPLNQEVQRILQEFFSEAETFFSEIKSFILRTLSNFSSEDAFTLYWSLFKKYPFKEKPLIIFTTNYDLIIEEAFIGKKFTIRKEWKKVGVKELYLGFEFTGIVPIFNLNLEKVRKPGVVSIMKLHGSINWKPHDDIILLGDKNPPDNPDVPFLIYPGYKGVPDKEPFLSLHLAFLNTLMEAKRLIVVGFAFRDLYINSIVHHALSLNRGLEVHVVVPEFPEDSLFPILKERFPDRVFHHRERVELQDGEVKPNLWNLIEKAKSEQQ